ncbi:MAG: MFS transporter [Caldilineaceae bacterium SB0670_bin_27]|uniref:MFS transporter n=1 Tax=Caldilineaceae bacterium SB0664_bin_27 TaxID=2605260 RepID=A0A6B0YWQ9_9CHLR|nr:MFS transporter [Caldilineaceae bacterium SB0664_bin_27]MYJ79628.1 MFS transporter [Caldilineaceae bacterium SB0670_bin_27]
MTSASDEKSDADLCQTTGFVQLPRRQVAVSMTCVNLVMFLAALGQTTVATALPSIVADLGGFDRYVWIATAYMVAATVTAPIAGGLSDLYGRKPFFIFGLVVFIVSSALLGVSQSMSAVIAFRAVQGIGGGLVMTASLVSVADLYPPEERGKYQGSLAGVFGVASIVGPVVGGYITHHFHWNWIFLLNVIFALPILLLIIWVFPRVIPNITTRKPDYLGMISLAVAVVPVLLALSFGGVQYAWSSPQCLGLMAFGLAMAVAFVVVESRAESPIMSLRLYTDRFVASAMMVMLLTGFILYGSLLFLPLFFQGVLGVSAAASGRLLVPMLPGIVGGAILFGLLLSRTGGRFWLHVLVTTTLAAVGMYLMSTMNEATGVFRIVSYLVLAGVGIGGTLTVLSAAIQNSVPFSLVGAGTSASQFWRSVGGMMGLAVMGAVLVQSFRLKVEARVPDEVRAALPAGLLDSVKENPQALLNPAEAEALREVLAEAGSDDSLIIDSLLDSLNAALADGLSNVFTVLAVVATLSCAGALLLRVQTGTDNRPNTLVSQRRFV